MSTPAHDEHEHDRGLAYDLPRLLSRRQAVGWIAGGFGSAVLAACGSAGGSSATTVGAATASGASASGAAADVAEVADETAGPFPGDGSNGPNVLAQSGVVRSDIRTSFGGASGEAHGVPTTVAMRLLDVAAGGTPLAGAAVYIWHCDREGRYSMYDQGAADANYLRGVQVSDRDGRLAFTTIFPGAYAGRWPHVHFEVYDDVEAATSGAAKRKTSQIALPARTCELVYATAGYEQSAGNLRATSLETDMVFSDGYAGQLATASGTVAGGLALSLNVGV